MPNCSIQGCGRPTEGRLELCATHAREARKAEKKGESAKVKEFFPIKPLFETKKTYKIPKVSGKMARLLQEYSRIKREWIKGKMCAVLKNVPATDAHHKLGRVGFADQWARDNNVPLLIDTRFWLPVSRAGHRKVELLPDWAKEQGFSLSRLEKRD